MADNDINSLFDEARYNSYPAREPSEGLGVSAWETPQNNETPSYLRGLSAWDSNYNEFGRGVGWGTDEGGSGEQVKAPTTTLFGSEGGAPTQRVSQGYTGGGSEVNVAPTIESTDSNFKGNTPTSGNSAGGIVGAVFDMVNQVIGGVTTIGSFFGLDDASQENKKRFKEAVRQFDKTFQENVRQYNLDYALKEFATRKGLSLQEVQQEWDRRIGNRKMNIEEMLAEIQQQKAEQDMKQQKYDFDKEVRRDNAKSVFSKGFSVGMLKGLTGK